MLHLAKNIKIIRLLSGLNQTEFGKLFDATKAMIVSYESGKAKPDMLFISRLKEFSKVDEGRLLNSHLTEADIKISKVEKLEKLQGSATKKPDTVVKISGSDIEKTGSTELLSEFRNTKKYITLLEKQNEDQWKEIQKFMQISVASSKALKEDLSALMKKVTMNQALIGAIYQHLDVKKNKELGEALEKVLKQGS